MAGQNPTSSSDAERDDQLDAYDFELPPEAIAQTPAERRDRSRLLVHDRSSQKTRHSSFHQLGDHLRSGDVLVLNNTRVIPARISAVRPSGGRVEILLHPSGGSTFDGGSGLSLEKAETEALALLRPSARVAEGERLLTAGGVAIRVLDAPGPELRRVCLEAPLEVLLREGQVPLPPYLSRNPQSASDDQERYQTVYADQPGAIAAPTAGLHFTPGLLDELRARGVGVAPITLHVGPGTFLPVRTDRLSDHPMHEEWFEIPEATIRCIEEAKSRSARVVAVGTTTTRALEGCVADCGELRSGWHRTRLMIRPPYSFAVIDSLITNFHLPRSTLLALVSAFASREKILALYREAIASGYRFYSYGDAMLLR